MDPGGSHPLHRLWKEKLTRVGSTCPHNPVQLGKTEMLQRQGGYGRQKGHLVLLQGNRELLSL